MGASTDIRVRRGRAVAAIAGPCLAVVLAGCGSAASPPASPATPAALRATTPTPAATAGDITTPASATASAGPIDTSIKVYGDCTSPRLEPAEIVLTCADYGVLVDGLHWTRWTAAGATATGTLVYNDCTPNCAEGHRHQVPGTRITLTVPVRGAAGQLVWSQIQEYPEPPGYQTGPYHGGPQPLPIRRA